ncbi:MAG: methionyl-tRNA formyltransferase [Rhodospirillaceae bacterium]|nr:methionyl-tRNA formyltransferase [Rhodospirillaceae bacterium]
MSGQLRLAFMGSPDFSVPILGKLIAAGHRINAVYCQPPRAAGRGQKQTPVPVHAYAEARGLEVRTPESPKDTAVQEEFKALDLDAAVVAAYGLILPKAILDAPRMGCINVHASLLPRWRGAAPIQRAILAGDSETGVTIMQMDEGLDTGPELMRESVAITGETTGQSLHDTLAAVGAALIVKALDGLEDGSLTPRPQPEAGVTYAGKLHRSEARIDWRRAAPEIERQVRAFTPWPGSWFEQGGARLSVLGLEVAPGAGPPGEVLDDALLVACGDGAVRITRLQRSGGAPMGSEEFLRGRPIPAGTRLD